MESLRAVQFAVSAFMVRHHVTVGQVLLAVVGALFCIGGNSGQVISLNFWLDSFPGEPAPFVVLTLVAGSVALLYGISLGIWVAVKRPSLAFALDPVAIVLSLLCGLCNSLNGTLLVYATPGTPELLQAMLLSTGIFWTFLAAGTAEIFMNGFSVFRKLDRRAVLVPISFVFCLVGIILGAGSFHLDTLPDSKKKWTAIFAAAQVPGALYNVIGARYMMRFTTPEGKSSVINDASSGSRRHGKHADHVTVKMVLLVVSSFAQAIFLWCYFPMDWVQGFGLSATREIAVNRLVTDYKCVFFTGCDSATFWYFFAFAIAYALALIGLAILNHISAPMCSMVSQIAAPTAAVILLIFPSLNAQNNAYEAGTTVGGLILITFGSLLYVFWARFMQPPEASIEEAEHFIESGTAQYPYGTAVYNAEK